MEAQYTKDLKILEENVIVTGTVVSVTSTDVVLNIGLSLTEWFRSMSFATWRSSSKEWR